MTNVSLAERARARRAPAWRWRDTLTFLVVAFATGVALLRPAWAADLGDTVVGSLRIAVPQQGVPDVSWSQLLLNLERFLVIFTGCYVLFAVRSIPMIVRLFLIGSILGLEMNYARNVFSGNPATASFLLINLALLLNNVRLMVRPSVWEQMVAWRNRAERAEAEADDLRQKEAETFKAAETWRLRALAAEAVLPVLQGGSSKPPAQERP